MPFRPLDPPPIQEGQEAAPFFASMTLPAGTEGVVPLGGSKPAFELPAALQQPTTTPPPTAPTPGPTPVPVPAAPRPTVSDKDMGSAMSEYVTKPGIAFGTAAALAPLVAPQIGIPALLAESVLGSALMPATDWALRKVRGAKPASGGHYAKESLIGAAGPLGGLALEYGQAGAKSAAKKVLGLTRLAAVKKEAGEQTAAAATRALRQLDDKVTRHVEKLQSKVAGAETAGTKAAETALEREQQRVQDRLLGLPVRTAEERLGTAAMQEEAGATLREQVTAPVWSVFRRVQDRYGKQYDRLFNPHLEKAIPNPADFAEQAQAAQIASTQFGGLTDRLNSLYGRVAKWGETPTQGVKLGRGKLEDAPPGLLKALVERGEIAPPPTVNVAEVLGIRRDAEKLTTSGTAAQRKAARDLVGVMDNALDSLGVKGSKELNRLYRQWRGAFDEHFRKTMAKGLSPDDFSSIYAEPTVLGKLVQHAKPEELGQLRTGFAQFARAQRLTPLQMADALQGPIGRKLYPDVSATQWRELNQTLEPLQRLIDRSPQLQAVKRAETQRMTRLSLETVARDVQRDIATNLRAIGTPHAKALAEEVRALSPIEAFAQYAHGDLGKRVAGLSDLASQQAGAEFLAAPSKTRAFARREMGWSALVGAGEMMSKGHLSAWVEGAFMAGAAMYATTSARDLLLRGLESPGMVRMLANAARRGASMTTVRTLGRLAGRMAAADALRAVMSGEEPQQPPPQPGTNFRVLPQGTLPVAVGE